MSELGDRIGAYLGPEAVSNLKRYYRAGSTFSGRAFETLAGGGDREETCNRFVADDIVAVSLLSVNIPPDALLAVLEPPNDEMEQLLRRIPNHTDLWTVDKSVIDRGSYAKKLWKHLDEMVGIGWVTAGKLMARNRPGLIPVFDRVVRDALMPKASDTWWVSLWEALQDRKLVQRLADRKAEAGLDPKVSLLRVLDVAVWMAGPRA